MAIGFRAASEANNTDNSGAINILVPAGAVAGDLLVLIVNMQDEDTPLTLPSGWSTFDSETSLSGTGAQVPAVYVLTRTATASGAGSAGSSVTLTPNATGRKKAVMLAYSGASGLGAFGRNSLVGGNVAAPSINLSASSSWLLCAFAAAHAIAGSVLTPDSPLTVRHNDSHSFTQLGVGDQAVGASGATGTRTATASGGASAPTPEIAYSIEILAAEAVVPSITLAGQVQPVTAAVTAAAVADVTVAGQVGPVTADVQATALVDVTLAGQVGPVTADVQVEAAPDEVEVELAGQVGPVTAAVTVDVALDVDLAGQVGPVTAAVAVEIADAAPVISADTTDRRNGRARAGLARVQFQPALVPPPSVLVTGSHRRMGAIAHGPVTMQGTQPVYATSAATAPRLRLAIFVGGKDISFLRGVPTPEPGYQLAEPLLWGPSAIELPQIAAAFESLGVGDLKWCAKGKPVVYKLVDDTTGTVEAITYRGVVIDHDADGPVARIEIGGHAQGRAALQHKRAPIFRDVLDLGRLAWSAIRDLGLAFEPRLGPTTGIRSGTFGDRGLLDFISELCAKAWQRDGTQWTIMPDDDGTYTMVRKDTETVHFTVFCDDTSVRAQLRSDAAEEPNRFFATGVTPRGQRVRFGVYPGLVPGPAAPYPFDDDRTFGLGTADEDTDTGDGVTVMLTRMWQTGYLSLEEKDNAYDVEVTRAVMALQEDAGRPTSGNMNPATWSALFDLDVTGYSLRGSQIEPVAQTSATRRYDRSASGAIIGKNPGYDRRTLVVDRHIDFGSGFTRHQMREFARAERDRFADPDRVNMHGTIQINTGAVLAGDVPVGAAVTPDMLLDIRQVKPGMNARVHHGGRALLMHVAVSDIDSQDGAVTTGRLTVDTEARDAPTVWEVIRRNKETRRDPARRWQGNRASTQVKDSVIPHDEVMGVLYGDRALQPGWNVIPLPAGQEGTVSRVRLLVQDLSGGDGEVAIRGREFACAVFGKKVTPARLRLLIGNPLAASPESATEPVEAEIDPPDADPEVDGGDPGSITSPSRPWWEREKIEAALRRLEILHSAGTHELPCGYSPGRKSNGGTRTGLYRRDASFSYRTHREPVLYLAVWVWGERTLSGGRVLWPQLEAGA